MLPRTSVCKNESLLSVLLDLRSGIAGLNGNAELFEKPPDLSAVTTPLYIPTSHTQGSSCLTRALVLPSVASVLRPWDRQAPGPRPHPPLSVPRGFTGFPANQNCTHLPTCTPRFLPPLLLPRAPAVIQPAASLLLLEKNPPSLWTSARLRCSSAPPLWVTGSLPRCPCP